MIQEFVDRFEVSKQVLIDQLAKKHPGSYGELVEMVVRVVAGDEYGHMDAERVHEIDDGDYQGTLVFVIAGSGYQPSDYWYVKVGYGSCSGCDTLQAISGYSSEPPTPEQVNDYMTLALHIVQGIKKMGGDAA
jgi:hypothetical protein